MVGRGSRIPDGISNLVEARAAGVPIAKDDCILIDMVHASSKHSLVTLPSLFGLNVETDLHGKSIVTVVDLVEKLKAAKPYLDLTLVKDVNDFKSYAEQVDLFKMRLSPEIIQISGYQWHKTGNNAYVLLLMAGESMTVLSDILERWHIVGDVNGNHVRETRPTFDEAIRAADYKVQSLRGRSLELMVKRVSKWGDGEPSPAQRIVCKRLGIQIPAGATKGEVHTKMGVVINARREARLRRLVPGSGVNFAIFQS